MRSDDCPHKVVFCWTIGWLEGACFTISRVVPRNRLEEDTPRNALTNAHVKPLLLLLLFVRHGIDRQTRLLDTGTVLNVARRPAMIIASIYEYSSTFVGCDTRTNASLSP